LCHSLVRSEFCAAKNKSSYFYPYNKFFQHFNKQIMKIITRDNYEAISKQTADELIEVMSRYETPLLSPASGSSPLGLYNELVARHQQKKLDHSNWLYVGLDEWVGMGAETEGSCRYRMDHDLFFPMQVKGEAICFFDGKAENLSADCERVEKFIEQQGGIDVVVLGVGMNGHVGLNEPGTSPSLRAHVTAVDPITQKVAQKYFPEHKQLSQGITLGIANLLEAKHLFILINGAHKAEITKRVIEGEVSEQVPTTLLREHKDIRFFLDAEAARLLENS
jgi:glucosamine-6-phosphate isomerase